MTIYEACSAGELRAAAAFTTLRKDNAAQPSAGTLKSPALEQHKMKPNRVSLARRNAPAIDLLVIKKALSLDPLPQKLRSGWTH